VNSTQTAVQASPSFTPFVLDQENTRFVLGEDWLAKAVNLKDWVHEATDVGIVEWHMQASPLLLFGQYTLNQRALIFGSHLINVPLFTRISFNPPFGTPNQASALDAEVSSITGDVRAPSLIAGFRLRIAHFLRGRNLRFEIMPHIEADPEYDWKQVEVQVLVDSDYPEIESLKQELVNLAVDSLPRSLLEHTLISVDKLASNES
jgi:hypothetical protein